MSLKEYSHEDVKQIAMIELANSVLVDEKKSIHFKDIFDQVAKMKDLSEEEKTANIAQFYTELNVDGRFITLGENTWGLKRWYPVEKMDEEGGAPKKKKKAKVTKEKPKAKPKKEKKEEDEELHLDEEELDIVDEDIDEMVDELGDEGKMFDEDEEISGIEEEAVNEEESIDEDEEEKT
ncbi:DNA-directed RNA polymerase subunit delta [Virgibacillus sp. NKC19-16]|uniref:DNA-directed RNA polymerase subunit delta n=1 Tax=Virgibacillus salidurans TaxID=2831673 RepID=UPI001F44024E|nr:DNA-directed RNA polymerase subunit delta [Virgibacillus sp. NKC19-16]UJL46008.1 DNA-directed RNA polymerase subunit delta [Virgibacillus sp. NKC19-16]